ncbi:hypothetical protein Tco_0800768 [Tanacetum coccineum]|uniref:Uncharacterized protein n=1 Tax=Tanacetum coccineum TaxID=301880 RepID=A0ABQ4ZV28_9ASTR
MCTVIPPWVQCGIASRMSRASVPCAHHPIHGEPATILNKKVSPEVVFDTSLKKIVFLLGIHSLTMKIPRREFAISATMGRSTRRATVPKLREELLP